MKDFKKHLNEIQIVIDTNRNELSAWNLNYLKMQSERYLKDLMLVFQLGNIKKILEVGGAPFHLSYILKQEGYDVMVLDIAPNRFRSFIDIMDLSVVKCDIERDDFPQFESKFDLILFNEVFEHLRMDPIVTLRRIAENLSENGTMFLSTPNFYSIGNILNFIRGRPVVNAFFEFQKLHKIGHMGHVREYSIDEMKLFIDSAGLEIVSQTKFNTKDYPFFSKVGFLTRLFPKTKTHLNFQLKHKRF